MGYAERKPRSIASLKELKPGDHIQVPTSSTCSSSSSSSISGSSSGSRRDMPEKCDGTHVTHHLLVVKVIDEKYIRVIHKVTPQGVVEENKYYLPKHITVLEYESEFTGQAAIERAREMTGEYYDILTNNCEHFVTEVRTGVKQCPQVEGAVRGGVAGARSGAAVGATTGALVGAGVGSIVPGAGTAVGAGVGAIVGGTVMGVKGGTVGAKSGTKSANVQMKQN